MKVCSFFLVSIALCESISAQYTAAVVEYSSLRGTSLNNTVEINLNEYMHYIETAKARSVDIIVFPEYGLTGWFDTAEIILFAVEIPPINNGTIFENYWLQRLSNAAREHSMYIVVNLLEKATDESNKTLLYNTNVVFDKNGILVTKYRKINLYYEDGLTPGNETVTFTTDFGVTFGLMTCFDIFFYHPSQTLLLDKSVTDIIYPSAWIATFPLYHSISTHLGYVQANNVNFLAAGLNSPQSFSSGSGIYIKDGTVETYYLSGQASSKMLISRIPNPDTPRNEDGGENIFNTYGFGILNDTNKSDSIINFNGQYLLEESNKYKNKILDLSRESISETLCDGEFCCNITITTRSAEVNVSEIYQLVVFNGATKTIDIPARLQLCAILACESKEIHTCGTRNRTYLSKFRQISVKADFEGGPEHVYRPTSLNQNLLPVLNATFTCTKSNESVSVSYTTQRTEENLIAFGVHGRVKSGSTSTYASFIGVMVLVALTNVFL